MANWDILKSALASIIKTNGNQEITGQLLQNALSNIVTSLGENATFAGIAVTSTNPGTPDGPVFYLAIEAGVYANFSGIEVAEGEAVILHWNNRVWTKKISGFATQEKFTNLQNQINANDTAIQKIQDEIEDLPSIRDNLDTLNSLKPEYYTEYKDAGIARLNAPDQVSLSTGETVDPPHISINEPLDEVHLQTMDGKASVHMTEDVIEIWAKTHIDFGTTKIKSKVLVPAAITQKEMEDMQTDGTWATFLAENPNVYVYEE